MTCPECDGPLDYYPTDWSMPFPEPAVLVCRDCGLVESDGEDADAEAGDYEAWLAGL